MLIVFDLDFTIWNCGNTWCDATIPPYNLINGEVYDSYGSCMKLYPDTLDILNDLQNQSIPLALASRTSAPDWANELLSMHNIGHYFSFKEIYPGSKITHFNRLQQITKINYQDMLFFDDEYRNIEEVSTLGVECIFVPEGITKTLVHSGLELLMKR